MINPVTFLKWIAPISGTREEEIVVPKKVINATLALKNSGIAEVVYEWYKHDGRERKNGVPWFTENWGETIYRVDDFKYFIELEKNPGGNFSFPRIFIRLENKNKESIYKEGRYMIPLNGCAEGSYGLSREQLEFLEELIYVHLLR